jgi:hypothetical protein
MQTISAIFDGNYFKPMEPIPVEGKYEVLIENGKMRSILQDLADLVRDNTTGLLNKSILLKVYYFNKN